tara:strand:- start:679 stop:1281 length:603 start_codon:yes stop_codon:yes gene_type:complete
MDYEAMAEDVASWIDTQSIEPATLIGHSMGGKVAMRLACSEPERIEKLIVVDIAPKAYSPHHREAFAAMHSLDLSTLTSRKEAEEHMAKTIQDWALRQFLLTNLIRNEDQSFAWQVNLPTLTQELPKLSINPLEGKDRFIKPTLFIRGEDSDFMCDTDKALITRFFPKATMTTIPKAGHNPHIEAKEACLKAVYSFLNRT